MRVTIFYSWQSDLPNPINRGFIQNALEKVATQIRDDGSISVEPVIDRDTSGVAGSPDIADIILSKIDACHVFVGDVSIINSGTTDRPTPNPNVLIELGYALKRLGWERIVMVQNTGFGGPDFLPFDLRKRRVVTYHLPNPDVDRSAAKAELKGKLKDALEVILTEIEKEDQAAVEEPYNPVDIIMDHTTVKRTSDRHDYRLFVRIVNNGTATIDSYHMDFEFPRAIVDESKYDGNRKLISGRCTTSHYFFRIRDADMMQDLFPGDSLKVIHIDYHVDTDLFHHLNAVLDQAVKATLYVSGLPPKTVTKSARELQVF